MKNLPIKKIFFYAAAIGIGGFALFYIATCLYIGTQVGDRCLSAMSRYYRSDCVEALVTQLNDENQGFGARNSAIWALGQLGDARALPVLQSYYTGVIPDREPWNGTISQYELKKAINLTSGGFNMGAWVWRWRLN
jgi:hypothetical protein